MQWKPQDAVAMLWMLLPFAGTTGCPKLQVGLQTSLTIDIIYRKNPSYPIYKPN